MFKKEEIKKNLKYAYCKTKDWCGKNKEVIIAVAPTVIGGSIELIKIIVKRNCVSEEKKLRDKYIYDRDNGHYYELRRKPKNSEWLKLDHMKEIGIPIGVALNEMELLK